MKPDPKPPRKGDHFVMLPIDAARRLGDSDYVVLLSNLIVRLRAARKEGQDRFRATNGDLAVELGKSRDKVQRALNAIEAAGYFLRVKDGGRWFEPGPGLATPDNEEAQTGLRQGADGPAPREEALAQTGLRQGADGPAPREEALAQTGLRQGADGPAPGRRRACARAQTGLRLESPKSRPGNGVAETPLFEENPEKEEENRNETLTAGALDGERRPEGPPATPHAAPSSETPSAREAALRSHWAMLPAPEREAIVAEVKAANPAIGRFKNMLELSCLKALADRHPDLYPPLAMPASSPEPPAPIRPEPPPEVSGRIEWLGRWGDSSAVPDLAEQLMLKLDDSDSGPFYEGHLIPELASSGPEFAGLIAGAFRKAMKLPQAHRARKFGQIVKWHRSRRAQKTARPVSFAGSLGGRSERQPRPRMEA